MAFNRDRGAEDNGASRRGAEATKKAKRSGGPHVYDQRAHYDFAIRKLRVSRLAVEDLARALKGWAWPRAEAEE